MLVRERGARALEERLGARKPVSPSLNAHADIEAPLQAERVAESGDGTSAV
jgi:hypothetical protein